MKSFTFAESLGMLAAERATNCLTAQGRAVWREIMPIVQPDPPDLAAQMEAKTASMISPPQAKPAQRQTAELSNRA
jgi:hypothetical protein